MLNQKLAASNYQFASLCALLSACADLLRGCIGLPRVNPPVYELAAKGPTGCLRKIAQSLRAAKLVIAKRVLAHNGYLIAIRDGMNYDWCFLPPPSFTKEVYKPQSQTDLGN